MQLAKYVEKDVFEGLGGRISIPATRRLLPSNTSFEYVIGNYYLICLINKFYQALPVGYTDKNSDKIEFKTKEASITIGEEGVKILKNNAYIDCSDEKISLNLAGIGIEISQAGINFNTNGKMVSINNKPILTISAVINSTAPGSPVVIVNAGQP